MYQHHTKSKGDAGLGFVIADLLSSGLQVALPISEHLPFDCIAIGRNGELSRLSVKYRKVDNRDRLEVKLESSWSNASGHQKRDYDKSEFDATAVYCPETGVCYYIRNGEVEGKTIALRMSEPKQRQSSIRMASDFEGAERIFMEGCES